jgi:hypothetical protein
LRTRTLSNSRRTIGAALALVLTASSIAVPAPASAGSGGIDTGNTSCAKGGEAKLSNGLAKAPCGAPHRVVGVIKAANKIAKGYPYCWGGGHSSFRSSCYDCSGSVSYALHGGDLLDSPLDSTGLESWGSKGKGNWITVYANSGHAYMVVAGLRFDTSMTVGKGPGWSSEMRSSDGYKVRHKGKL